MIPAFAMFPVFSVHCCPGHGTLAMLATSIEGVSLVGQVQTPQKTSDRESLVRTGRKPADRPRSRENVRTVVPKAA